MEFTNLIPIIDNPGNKNLSSIIFLSVIHLS
ncbi:unnamed protein product [Schistosoma curassoni]|nr:unnamed protein product [Schistosoma curassoni]